LDVGATKLKSTFPNIFVISEKLVIVGVPLFTVRDVVIVPEP